MVAYKQIFFEVSHDSLAYKIAAHRWGNDNNKDIIFCVHGLARNARDFDFIAEVLAEKYQVIAFDVVGRGQSDWLVDKTHYNYQTYIEDFSQIIKQMGIKKLNWLGTSMGGIIGMAIAAKYPELIDKIVLNDIGTFIPKAALQRIAKYVSIIPEFENVAAAKDFFKMILVNFGIKEEEHWDHIVEHSIAMQENGKYTMLYDPGIAQLFRGVEISAIEDVNIREEWQKVAFKKMLIVRGEKSDVFPADDLEYMINSKPNIQSLLIKGVGHAPALVNPWEIQPIKDFFFS